MADAPAHLTIDPATQSFNLLTDGKRSFINYTQPNEHTLVLTHTEVDPALEGRGVASQLVQSVLEHADQHGLKIVPVCSFVATYPKRHPDWLRLVSTDYRADDF